MSIVIEYKDGILKEFKRIKKRRTPSALLFSRRKGFVCSGEIFNITYRELMNISWIGNPNKLNELEGAISVIQLEKESVYFATDLNGIDTFYYYHKNKHFILSDDFWDIIDRIEYTIEDIDKEGILDSLFAGGGKNGRTFIKNIKILMPSQIGEYNFKENILLVKNYQSHRYTPRYKSMSIAVERMDELLRNSMKMIKNKCGDITYGVGVSGGLDSRIILHYAKKANMKIVGFNICVPKPNKIIYARSIKNSLRLTNIYGIENNIVKWDLKTLKEKIKLAIIKNPECLGNSFKYEESNLPQFDILLTGGTGVIIGSGLPKNIDLLTKEELINCIYKNYSYSQSTLSSRIKRAINYILNLDLKEKKSMEKKSYFGKKLNNNYNKIIYYDISKYVEERINRGLSNLDIYMDYSLNVCAFRNRYGAFESLFGQKRSFSIYAPFLFKETLNWSQDMLSNRKVLNELIIKKIPEVSEIESESFYVAPKYKKASMIKRIYTLIEFLIRGNGTSIDEYYLSKKRLKKQFINSINKNTDDWFHKIFNINQKITLNELKREPIRIIARIIEIKNMLDYLERKLGENSEK